MGRELVSGIKLQLSGVAASSLAPWAILSHPNVSLYLFFTSDLHLIAFFNLPKDLQFVGSSVCLYNCYYYV